MAENKQPTQEQIKEGDMVRYKYPPYEIGEVIRISKYDNPYRVFVKIIGKKEVVLFKREHLEVIHNGRETANTRAD